MVERVNRVKMNSGYARRLIKIYIFQWKRTRRRKSGCRRSWNEGIKNVEDSRNLGEGHALDRWVWIPVRCLNL